MLRYSFACLMLCACSVSVNNKRGSLYDAKNFDSLTQPVRKAIPEKINVVASARLVNDTLNQLAGIIGGTSHTSSVYQAVSETEAYKLFSENFNKRWQLYTSTRLPVLLNFSRMELQQKVNHVSTLFYPFSGADILYPRVFFPHAKKYIMIGLEPVGTLPDFSNSGADIIDNYYKKLNEALFAILQFSFFRTESMRNDLKSGELDGVLHVLFLFLNRTGNNLVSARPMYLDSMGNKIYLSSFESLKHQRFNNKGVEILFNDSTATLKELNYFSINAANESLKHNTGMINFLSKEANMDVYLKGASYLLHKPHFSVLRRMILKKADHIVQDDSGIALNFLIADSCKWNFHLYGAYTRPIAKFASHYQPLLDSLYKTQGSKKLDFGIGYNYRDKNSNFMVASKALTVQ